jgi:UDP-glucose 4-epimerase
MLNFLSLEDAGSSLQRAIHQVDQGVFNVPGADILPLSMTIQRWGRLSLPAPESVLSGIYRARRIFRGGEFRYGMNRRRFHYSGMLDGRKAMEVLRYIPSYPIDWPLSELEAAER